MKKKTNMTRIEKMFLFFSILSLSLCTFIPIILFYLSLFNEKLIIFHDISIALGMIFGVIAVCILFFTDISNKPASKGFPSKIKLTFKTFEEVNLYLNETLESVKYKSYISNNIKFYYKSLGYKKGFSQELEVYSIVYVEKMEEDILSKIENEFIKFLEEMHMSNVNYISFIPVIITNNKNEMFENYINFELVQEKNRKLLPVAYLLSNKTLYVVNQTSSIGIGYYNEIKKRFIKTFKFKNEKIK